MKIVIDRAIPLIEGVLEPFAQVEYQDGAAISASSLREASALVTRTRTTCNRELLEGSSVEIICSATIGYDHIDMAYCAEKGIVVKTAAGCNSRAVLQWFTAAMKQLCNTKGWSPQGVKIGVVGVGSVGSLIAEYAAMWGFTVICCDPARAEAEKGFSSTPLEELLPLCDVVTLHTPLDASTQHMINSHTLNLMKQGAVVINSSRGGVVETQALLRSEHDYILDVWEAEPNISRELLEGALLATPHIAGYSVQGKARATAMAINHLSSYFGFALNEWQPSIEWPTPRHIRWKEMIETIDNHFDIKALSDILKTSPTLFESLRDNYDYRTDYF